MIAADFLLVLGGGWWFLLGLRHLSIGVHAWRHPLSTAERAAVEADAMAMSDVPARRERAVCWLAENSAGRHAVIAMLCFAVSVFTLGWLCV